MTLRRSVTAWRMPCAMEVCSGRDRVAVYWKIQWRRSFLIFAILKAEAVFLLPPSHHQNRKADVCLE
jgi:hypothetical protein